MNKRIWLLFLAAVIIFISLLFINNLADGLAREEQQKMENWAEATRLLLNDEYSDFVFNIIEQNENIPVIVVDDQDKYLSARNFNEPAKNIDKFYEKQIKRLKFANPPIEIKLDSTTSQYIYYGNSKILTQLEYFPYVQLSIIALFILLAIWVLSSDKKAEQNKLWVGLSKETAHQLGTPISSLLGWIELLKLKNEQAETVAEMSKDVDRLKIIAERFSKIGSKPELTPEHISEQTNLAVNYMLNRTSKKIEYSIENKATNDMCMLSPQLYEWVIENLCKNAVDAIEGNKGTISLTIFNENKKLMIEIEDSGKGIEHKKYKTIFKPGYTTKKRGWGLGLSLAKRIVEEYLKGRIYVKSSAIGIGTTFRIELPTYGNN